VPLSKNDAVSTKPASAQLVKIFYKPCTDRIEVDVSDKLQEVWGFLTQDGFIPVLKKLSMPPVSMIEPDGISGEKSSHDMR